MRARPQRIVIERGGLRAEVDAALLDETRPPVDDDKPQSNHPLTGRPNSRGLRRQRRPLASAGCDFQP